ncbi:ATP-binding protein [Streptomyces sp. bgisy159]|uniref:ATP-binding protein n=1 Tax=Streptomyces sp. bgisy159 TaxID=3413795 RepID=UPI003F4A2FFF
MLETSGARRPDPAPRYGASLQPPMRAGHVSVAYEPRPSAVREARAEVRTQLDRWGLGDRDDLVDTTELLVSELATNALLRPRGTMGVAGTPAATPFRLTLSAAHDVLRCEVADTGARGAEGMETGGVEGGRFAENGRFTEGVPSLFLVRALARRWGYHRAGPGEVVWFELGTCECGTDPGTPPCPGRRLPLR